MFEFLPQIEVMARKFLPPDPESLDAIAWRLLALREAVGATQTEMCVAMGLGPRNSTWANYEGAERRIRIDHAIALCKRFGVTLEWVYRGHAHTLPPDIGEKIKFQELLARKRAKPS